MAANKAAITRFVSGLCAGALLALAGCAGNGSTNGDPGARPLPPGASCQTVRDQLNKLDAKGTQSKVEAAQQGKKLPPAQQADVDQYNRLLADYLGARCHVAPAAAPPAR